MDDGDRAQELAQGYVSKALAMRQAPSGLPGSDDCIDCDDPIPEARKAASPNAQRCADCQNDFEGK